MKKTTLRLFTLAMTAALLLGLTACGNSAKAGSDTTFVWWMASGENPNFYTDFDENPVIRYITANKTFENKDGNQVPISFDFQSGVIGSEVDNYNNMMATGTYPDLIDSTYMTSAADLYEQGIVLDMTEYVHNYMPNYMQYIADNPELARYFTTNVDGEEKMLIIPAVYEEVDTYAQWYGYAYRRDWIVKYGIQPDSFFDPMEDSEPRANPNAGKPFTGYYTLDNQGNTIQEPGLTENINGDSWTDDVIFPSGSDMPLYISDWEWMMEIFTRAMETEGIKDGYCMSLYYPGYLAVGDLVSGFGGIGPMWYLDETGAAQFGAVTEGFRSYLRCMNSWYERGWIDQRFSQRTGDPFYFIDNTTVRQGKVGIWLATASELMSRLQNSNIAGTDGIVVYTCPSPINDIYGPAETQLKKPVCFFSTEKIAGGFCVTDKAKDKDLTVLCRYLDYLFTEEGLLLMNGGLSEEQQKKQQDPVYQSFGLEYGYTPVMGENGIIMMDLAPALDLDDGGISSAMTGNKAWHYSTPGRILRNDTENYIRQRENWLYYSNSGTISGLINSRLSQEGQSTFQKLNSRIGSEYMEIEVPKFIMGSKDPDKDWDIFVSDLTKRAYQKMNNAYNEALGK